MLRLAEMSSVIPDNSEARVLFARCCCMLTLRLQTRRICPEAESRGRLFHHEVGSQPD